MVRAGISVALVTAFAFSAYGAQPPSAEWFLYWLGADGVEGSLSVGDNSVRGSRIMVVSMLDSPSGDYAIIAEIFDCTTRQFSLLGSEEFDASDALVRSYDNPAVEDSFAPVGLSSRQGIVQNGVCGGVLTSRPASVDQAREYFRNFERDVRAIQRR